MANQIEIIEYATRFNDSDTKRAFENLADSVDNVNGKIETLGNTASDSFEQAEQGVAGYSAQIELLQKRNLSLAASIERVNRLQATQGKLTADQVRRVQGLTKEVQENNAAIANYKNRITDVTALSKSFDTAGQSLKLTSSQAQNLSFQLQDVFTQVGAGTSVMQTLIQQGPQITSIFGGVGNTFRFAGQQAVGFLKSIFTLRGGVIGLVSALVALTGVAVASYFRRSREEAQAFERTMGGVKEQLFVVGGRLFEYGEALAGVVRGQKGFGDVLSAYSRIFTGYNDELERANQLGKEFVAGQQIAIAIANNLRVEEGRLIGTIDELRSKVSDTTKSYNERTAALKRAGELDRGLEAFKVQSAEFDLKEAEKKSRNAKGEIQFTEEVSIAQRKLLDLRNEAANRERADAATLRQLRQERADKLDEERKKVEALNEAYTRLLERLAQQATKSQAAGLTGKAKLEADRNIALTELERFVDEIQAAAKQAGVQIAPEVQEQIDAIFGGIQREFRKGFANLSGEELGLEQIQSSLGNGLEAAGKEAIKRLGIVFSQPPKTPDGLTLAEQLKKTLGLDDEQIQQLGQAASMAYNSFLVGLNAQTEAAISSQDRIIDAIRERIDEQESLLEIERQRAADGYANNLQAQEDALAAENVLLEQAQAKRQALEEKAARRTLLLNSIQQASEATLTIVRLLSSGAKLGPFGFIAAAAVGVSTVFSILAQAKAQAAKFSQVPGFKTGTEFLNGPGDGKSDSILVRASRGERILTAADNAALGGSQLPNKELVRYALIGQEIERGAAAKSRANAEAINAHKYAQQDFAGLTKGQMKEVASEIISYLKTRPVRKYDKNGGEVVEFMEGAAKVRQRVKK